MRVRGGDTPFYNGVGLLYERSRLGLVPSIIDINSIAIRRRGCVVLDIEMDFQDNGTDSNAHVAAAELPSASCGHGAFGGSVRAGFWFGIRIS